MKQFVNELMASIQCLILSLDSQTTGTWDNDSLVTQLRNLLQHLRLYRCRCSLPSSKLPQLLLLLLVAECRVMLQVICNSFEAAEQPGLMVNTLTTWETLIIIVESLHLLSCRHVYCVSSSLPKDYILVYIERNRNNVEQLKHNL